ncbi:hypothetical protein A2276_06470 [candidate division WOR-1 bacterium RIFOXYA12_FULL_43_27]|uniref:Segregation and condensation protein A n=1 Tax=candidate division WOR-1 bacterium RIFOXYC2_FULL_46_14 TaxID=1802587 RepID=A0A1F4U5P4_UNCSA|nr:MAG: hypothetical protein A2276_06470 [candidate division WOR-1 bacterium RIFOXYA12_FULL_43_27]OGC20294.1 MAG: hypothetical protein A2292_04470 [candidate division WOR-1 bacterium RIFOXYB2_FULL_46_45]OGC31969.1 MAG: hypothetical protein A2232_06980 [candidate division WOR-1 bacterium RIFOXYA2_FULL_46_56]OGC40140.1 MAG: hypothetical protein A2438_02490 [candidate division WOR-1 bacterium RIFOXYC2_FULL_46_14]
MQETYSVKTATYEGPFDLLLQAIKEGRIDVYDVSLTKITSEYHLYLKENLRTLNLNRAAEFLVMVACLLEMKSKKLLPEPPTLSGIQEEEEIELDLAAHIKEYGVYRDLALRLRERKEHFAKVYSRYHFEEENIAKEVPINLGKVSLEELVFAFQKIWREAREEEEIRAITEEPITLPRRIEEVKKILYGKERVRLEELFVSGTRLEIVVTFLAVLELTRQKFIYLLQGEKFGEIHIGVSRD